MNIDEKIKELEEKLEEIKKENEELKKDKQANNVRWRAEWGERYYILNDFGETSPTADGRTCIDKYRHAVGNYFKTEEQTKIAKQNRLTYQQLKDIALRLNKGQVFDWNDLSQIKYYIYFDFKTNQLKQWDADLYKIFNVIYCLDESFLDVALEEICEEKLKQLLEWGI